MKKSRVLSFKYFLYDFIRITALIPGLIWFRPKWIYESKEAKKGIKGGAIILANHISLYDPMYLHFAYWRRRQRVIAMKELFTNKFNRWLFTKAFRCIEIDRENFSMNSFKEIVDNLKCGNVVSIFPEGRVNVSGETINSFKGGLVMMASRGNAPIVPVFIKTRKHFYNRLVFAIGSPIHLDELKQGPIKSTNDVKEILCALENKERELANLTTLKSKK